MNVGGQIIIVKYYYQRKERIKGSHVMDLKINFIEVDQWGLAGCLARGGGGDVT